MDKSPPELPSIYKQQFRRECASELRRKTKDLLKSSLSGSATPTSFKTVSGRSSAHSLRPPITSSVAGMAYLNEVQKQMYYEKVRQRQAQNARQASIKQQKEEEERLIEEEEHRRFEDRVTKLIEEEKIYQPLIDSSYFLKDNFSTSTYSNLSRDEFVEREIKLAEFLRQINEYNKYADENEVANDEMTANLDKLEKELDEERASIDAQMDAISERLNSLKQRSEVLSEQISIAQGHLSSINMKKEQVLTQIIQDSQILEEFLESRNIMFQICQLKQYKQYAIFHEQQEQLLHEALQNTSQPVAQPEANADDEFGVLLDDFDAIIPYSDFFLDKSYFEKQHLNSNNLHETNGEQATQLIEGVRPRYFDVGNASKVDLDKSQVSSRDVLEERQVCSVLQVLKSIDCFRGVQFRYEREQRADPLAVLRQCAAPGYGYELERLCFRLGRYARTHPAVERVLRLLLRTAMPAFVPFRDAAEARELVESFYFNTQLVQEQLDYNAYNLQSQQRASAAQQAVVGGLEALTRQDGYRALAESLRRLRESYIRQLGFYEVLEFAGEEDRAQRVALLRQIDQYASICGVDCKVRDSFFFSTDLLYNYRAFESNNQLVLQQLEDKYEYLRLACDAIGHAYGVDMEPREFLAFADDRVARLLRRLDAADRERLREAKKVVRDEFLRGLGAARAEDGGAAREARDTDAADAPTAAEVRQRYNCQGRNLDPNKHVTQKNLRLKKLVEHNLNQSRGAQKDSTALFYQDGKK